jgi:FkbM family methyltransferase
VPAAYPAGYFSRHVPLRLFDFLLPPARKVSYAQSGEDLIIDFLFSARPPARPFFIDVGAHHPTYLNNTYLLYKKGWRGLNVDPLSNGIAAFNKWRQRDTNIQAGVDCEGGTGTLYVMDTETLSTFDKAVAAEYIRMGHRLKREEKVRFLSVAQLITMYQVPTDVALLSIDIEGDEYRIIRDFVQHGITPDVIVCETLAYSPKLVQAAKDDACIAAIVALGYVLYADTYINSIFVCERFWRKQSAPS